MGAVGVSEERRKEKNDRKSVNCLLGICYLPGRRAKRKEESEEKNSRRRRRKKRKEKCLKNQFPALIHPKNLYGISTNGGCFFSAFLPKWLLTLFTKRAAKSIFAFALVIQIINRDASALLTEEK